MIAAPASTDLKSMPRRRAPPDGESSVVRSAPEAAAGVLEGDASLAGHPDLRDALERRLDDGARAFLAKN